MANDSSQRMICARPSGRRNLLSHSCVSFRSKGSIIYPLRLTRSMLTSRFGRSIQHVAVVRSAGTKNSTSTKTENLRNQKIRTQRGKSTNSRTMQASLLLVTVRECPSLSNSFRTEPWKNRRAHSCANLGATL